VWALRAHHNAINPRGRACASPWEANELEGSVLAYRFGGAGQARRANE
jgi:hypothetical protein